MLANKPPQLTTKSNANLHLNGLSNFPIFPEEAIRPSIEQIPNQMILIPNGIQQR
jgi:hypothetical protein